MTLAMAVYQATATFPKHEQYGLTAQMRRAAVSIPANIAEGRGRFYRGDFARHVSIARGSVAEMSVFVELSGRLEYVRPLDLVPVQRLADEVSRMLTMLFRSLQRPTPNRE